MNSKVYIIITNFTHGWEHTLECLESVFRTNYPKFQVIVVDDSSEDAGLASVKKWAEGSLQVRMAEQNPLRLLSFPPVPKPIQYKEFRDEDVRGLDRLFSGDLILIQSTRNRGFAGAVNLGLKLSLARNDFSYVWLLNNDTVVTAESLAHLVHRLEEKPEAGLCGSVLLDYHAPAVVQTLGGAHFNPWTAIGKQIGKDTPVSAIPHPEEIEKKMDYVFGASLCVSKRFLQDVGLMDEGYFIYFEELDWARRARGKFVLAYAPTSIVYHKGGATVGGRYKKGEANSLFSDYYYVKNMLTFTRKHHPWALPTVCLRIISMAIQKLKGRQTEHALLLIKILLKVKVDPHRLFAKGRRH